MNKIRLLMGITLSEAGGSQKVVFSLLSGLPEELYDITLVTAPGGELLDWVKSLNSTRKQPVKVILLSCIRRNINPFKDLFTFFKLIYLMRKNCYDIAHFHNSKMGTLGRPAAKVCGIPKVIYTMHGLNLNKSNTGHLYPLLALLERIIAAFTDKIVFVSKHDMRVGLHNHWAKERNACLIYNGISECPSVSVSAKGKVPTLIFVARLSEPKDPLFMIRVSAKLLAEGYEHRLLIVGDGPNYDACDSFIRSLDLQEQITLTGHSDHVPELLAQSDIFCLFSKSEGLPISILEAMMAGLPVVASDVGGVSELVAHGKTGYLIPGFDKALTAEYLKILLDSNEMRSEFGALARSTAMERFHEDAMLTAYQDVYRS